MLKNKIIYTICLFVVSMSVVISSIVTSEKLPKSIKLEGNTNFVEELKEDGVNTTVIEKQQKKTVGVTTPNGEFVTNKSGELVTEEIVETVTVVVPVISSKEEQKTDRNKKDMKKEDGKEEGASKKEVETTSVKENTTVEKSTTEEAGTTKPSTTKPTTTTTTKPSTTKSTTTTTKPSTTKPTTTTTTKKEPVTVDENTFVATGAVFDTPTRNLVFFNDGSNRYNEVFVLKQNGKEIWRSGQVKPNASVKFNVYDAIQNNTIAFTKTVVVNNNLYAVDNLTLDQYPISSTGVKGNTISGNVSRITFVVS